jgi:hypothetical protein
MPAWMAASASRARDSAITSSSLATGRYDTMSARA